MVCYLKIKGNEKSPLGRFIPVHTGNINQYPSQFKNSTVYPCAYREHNSTPCQVLATIGLSLCIQGTSAFRDVSRKKVRFIPVHTGNIKHKTTESVTLAVYPCAYREHHKLLRSISLIYGLSLCIQGTYQL